jgi:hypothetical protein
MQQIEVANSCILICGCDSFFIMMSELQKIKAFCAQEKGEISAQVEANKEIHAALDVKWEIVMSALNMVVKTEKTLKSVTMWHVLWSQEELESVTISSTEEFVGCVL